MSWTEGIEIKLKRAKENIFDLNSEIEGFFNAGEYPILPEDNPELLAKAIEYHKNLLIPPRFAVLAGEIIHHLRSCFDHIAWHFSDGPVDNIRKIEFPIFDREPVNSEGRRLFEGKIKGITNPRTIALIKGLQPYNSANPLADPLWIIHDFDIVDKHRQLIICAGTASRVFPSAMRGTIDSYLRENPERDPSQIHRDFKGYYIAQPCISFRNFGGREIEPVIPGLTQLLNHTTDVVRQFEVL